MFIYRDEYYLEQHAEEAVFGAGLKKFHAAMDEWTRRR